jgi:hypothetical protein
MEENKYKFCNDTDEREAYIIAKIQFKKIIKNFQETKFKDNFDELFYDKKNYKLFLKKGDKLLCGALGFVYENKVFMDIFFWNFLFNDYDMNIVRLFFERFFEETTKINVNEAILPLDKHRKKFESFKKHNQTFFRSCEELQSNDYRVNEQYSHHYLLKVNYKNYFEQK